MVFFKGGLIRWFLMKAYHQCGLIRGASVPGQSGSLV